MTEDLKVIISRSLGALLYFLSSLPHSYAHSLAIPLAFIPWWRGSLPVDHRSWSGKGKWDEPMKSWVLPASSFTSRLLNVWPFTHRMTQDGCLGSWAGGVTGGWRVPQSVEGHTQLWRSMAWWFTSVWCLENSLQYSNDVNKKSLPRMSLSFWSQLIDPCC